MAGFTALYKSKVATPAVAVGRIASGATFSRGMDVNEPPALLEGLGCDRSGSLERSPQDGGRSPSAS